MHGIHEENEERERERLAPGVLSVDGEERGRRDVAGRRNSWWRERGFGVRMEEEASGKEKKRQGWAGFRRAKRRHFV